MGMPVANEVMKNPCLDAWDHSLARRKCISNGVSCKHNLMEEQA